MFPVARYNGDPLLLFSHLYSEFHLCLWKYNFTRSKKPVAEAFCEAVLLSHLREEQWSNFPAKRRRIEIYVIVRNLRSTAYRLALATIVLEQQVEDVESL